MVNDFGRVDSARQLMNCKSQEAEMTCRLRASTSRCIVGKLSEGYASESEAKGPMKSQPLLNVKQPIHPPQIYNSVWSTG